jgi:hypothetical protein
MLQDHLVLGLRTPQVALSEILTGHGLIGFTLFLSSRPWRDPGNFVWLGISFTGQAFFTQPSNVLDSIDDEILNAFTGLGGFLREAFTEDSFRPTCGCASFGNWITDPAANPFYGHGSSTRRPEPWCDLGANDQSCTTENTSTDQCFSAQPESLFGFWLLSNSGFLDLT